MKLKITTINLVFLVLGCFSCFPQDMLVSTKLSPKASVTQRIGTTDVTIEYHSPSAKGRTIFGGIVPYDFVVDGVEYPWRAGSNENTTISFTHDVKIQGESLPKGTYGLHIFIKEKEWTYIFSKNAESWGSFSYDRKDDALRVKAIPQEGPYQEWLNYEFVGRNRESAILELQWSNIKCAIEISTDVTSNVLSSLKSKKAKTSDDYISMAQLTLSQDPSNIKKALQYAEKSIQLGKKFRNMMLKSELLFQKGKLKESKRYEEEAIMLGEGFPYYYYYPLSFMLLEDNKQKTYEVLSEMLSKEPNNWIANLAMGEYYIKDKNQEKATFHFGKAYEYARERSKPYTQYMYLSNKVILERMQ